VASPTSLVQREREQRPSQGQRPVRYQHGAPPHVGRRPMPRAQHVPKRQRRDPSRHRIRAKGPSDTSMGQRPMLGAAPCHGHNTTPSANGAIHPFIACRLGVADVDCAGLWNGPSALVSGWRSVAWGVAPGWYEAAPLALASAARPTGPEAVRGQTHVARATRARATSISGPKARAIPAWGNAPCWAPPHATGTTRRQAPTARPIPAPHTSWVWRMWIARDYGTAFGPRVGLAFRCLGRRPRLV